MKFLKSLFTTVLFFMFLTTLTFSEIRVINFAGLSYTPSNLTVNVGDTIEWRGDFPSHPLSSTSVPAGAASFQNSAGSSFQYIVTTAGDYNYRCDFHFLQGMVGSFTAVAVTDVNEPQLVETFKLEQNYPNPFNPETTIRYRIPENSYVTLRVYDLIGNLKATLVNENKSPGSYEIKFNAAGLESGIYFYQIKAENFSDTKRFVLLK